MKGFINGIDWYNAKAMLYWSFPASYQKDKKTEIINLIYSGDYIGSLKVDGYYQRILKDEDGNVFMIARSRSVSGEVVDKIEWVPQLQDWFSALPNGSCLLTEIYLPGKEGSSNITHILGCLKEKAIERQKETPLHLYVFDVMAWAGENFDKTPYEQRTAVLNKIKTLPQVQSPYIEWTEFFEGDALWDKIQEYLSQGREGGVIMRKDAVVYDKRTPARISVKIKKELEETIDCIITAGNPPTKLYNGDHIENWIYWHNLKTDEVLTLPRIVIEEHRIDGVHNITEGFLRSQRGEPLEPVTKMYALGGVGSLQMSLYNEKTHKTEYFCDVSGIEEEILLHYTDYIGKVARIGGMSLSKDAKGNISVRHPRFMGIREDKRPIDCSVDQIR
jgi:hypothetical protein